MDLTLNDIIIRVIATEKASYLINNHQQVTLEVHPEANKHLVAQAVKKLLNAEVEKVRIIVRKGKIKRFKRMKTCTALSKRAIITLKDADALTKLTQTSSIESGPSDSPV